MKPKILLPLCFLLLILGTANAVYELCDSVERDSDVNAGFFRCNITTTKYQFSQQDIDAFWENMQQDGDYTAGRIGLVEWKIKQTVISAADDLRFIQLEGMNLAWDLVLEGDVNTTHDFNESESTGPRPTNHTAIKKKLGAMQEYLISFAPLGERRSIRNITLTKPEEAFAVYISGSVIKRMIIEVEGDITLTGSYIENIESLKAKNITLEDNSYLALIGSIEAENISLEGSSHIRKVGSFGETAISLKNGSTGLSIKDNSYIEDLSGGLEVEADIYLEENCKLENLQYTQSEAIQWIYADNITMKDGSTIKGFGGTPGEIILTGQLSLDESDIIGKATNKPSAVTAKGITLSNNSQLVNFSEAINVTGSETFRLEGGSSIDKFSGTINSCASISMDGNTTKISFTEGGENTIKAKSLDLNSEARIACIGKSDEECIYNFVEQNCDVPPSALLEVEGSTAGNSPLTVEFTGECNGLGMPVTCTIDFGDGSGEEIFDGNVMHSYETAGVFNAVLKATNANDQTATSERTITVTQEGLPPATDVQFTVSKQSVEKGGEISLNIDCNVELQTFRVENDLGLPPITEPPESCPTTLGPFTIPADAEPGTHSFSLLGKTAGNQIINKTVSFTVEETGTGFPLIPENLNEILLYVGIGVVIVVALIIVVVLIKKKKGRGGFKKHAPKPTEAKREEAPAEPETETPPWIRREEPKILPPKPVEKPAPPPQKPIIMEKPAAKPVQTQAEEDKPAVFVAERPTQPKAKMSRPEGLGKPGPKPLEKPSPKIPQDIAKPAETPEEPEPADRFKKLVQKLKRSKAEPKSFEKEDASTGMMPEQPAARPKPVLKKSVLDKLAAVEKKPTIPKKKPQALAKKPVAQPKKPIAIKKPAPKPIAIKKPAAAPEITDLPIGKPVEKPEKKGFSLFRKKKKPAKEEEKPAVKETEESELPPWLKKT